MFIDCSAHSNLNNDKRMKGRGASNKRHLFVLILGQHSADITQKYDCVSFAFCQSPLITVPRYTCILSANQSVPAECVVNDTTATDTEIRAGPTAENYY